MGTTDLLPLLQRKASSRVRQPQFLRHVVPRVVTPRFVEVWTRLYASGALPAGPLMPMGRRWLALVLRFGCGHTASIRSHRTRTIAALRIRFLGGARCRHGSGAFPPKSHWLQCSLSARRLARARTGLM